MPKRNTLKYVLLYTLYSLTFYYLFLPSLISHPCLCFPWSQILQWRWTRPITINKQPSVTMFDLSTFSRKWKGKEQWGKNVGKGNMHQDNGHLLLKYSLSLQSLLILLLLGYSGRQHKDTLIIKFNQKYIEAIDIQQLSKEVSVYATFCMRGKK